VKRLMIPEQYLVMLFLAYYIAIDFYVIIYPAELLALMMSKAVESMIKEEKEEKEKPVEQKQT